MTDRSKDQPDHKSPDDLLAEAIRAIEREAVPPGPPAELVAVTLRALEQSGRKAGGPRPLIPRGGVLKVLATAASLLLAASLAAVLLPVIQSASPAFADVFSQALQQVRDAQSMSYRQQLTIQGKPEPITTRQLIAADGCRRSELSGHVTIYDTEGRAQLTLIEPTHVAIVNETDEEPGFSPSKSLLDWLRHLQDLGDKPDQELGSKELGGKQVTGFLSTRDHLTFTMWINSASGEPVRVEYDCTVGGLPAHVVMSDFQFRQELDDKLFSFDVPAGYEVYGRPTSGKIEPSRGFQLAWSREGAWSGLAGAIGRPTVYALQYGGRVIELDSGGEEISTTAVDEGATALRAAHLTSGRGDQLLTFRILGPTVEARNAGGALLWSYGPTDGEESTWAVNDVAVADLDRDGVDEVIIGYNGSAGLHVLTAKGQLLWKDFEHGSVWHVAAGDVDGDARSEVLATTSTGKVAVFDAAGKHLRDIDPGVYAQTVKVCDQTGVTQERLEAALARRNDLSKRLREQELQLLLVKQSRPGENVAPPSEDAIEAELAKDPMIAGLTTRVAELKRAIDQQRTLSNGPRGVIGSLRHQIARTERQIQQRKRQLQSELLLRLTGGDVDPALTSDVQVKAVLPLLTAERDALKKSLAALDEDVEQQMKTYAKFDRETADLENRETQLEDLKSIIKRISYQLSLWNLELDAEQRIKVMDEAVKPSSDDAGQRNLLSASFGGAGFLLALFLLAVFAHLRWTHAAGVALVVGGAAAFAIWQLVPVSYEAQSLIKVSKVLPVVIQNVQNGGVDEGASFDIFRKTQVQWVKSPFVLNRAARKPEMIKLETMREHREDPAKFLESKIMVDFPGDAEVMRVAMKGTHRNDLPVIVNAVVQSYMEEIVTGDKMGRLKQRDLLSKHLSENKEQYRELSASIHLLAVQMDANSSEQALMRKKLISQQLESLTANRNTLAQRIRDVELQIRLLEERKAKKDGASSAPPMTDPRLEIEYAGDPVIAGLARQLDTLRATVKEQQNLAAPSQRGRFNLHANARQLAELAEHLQRRKRELQPDVVARLVGGAAGSAASADGKAAAMMPLLEAQRDALARKLALAENELEIAMQEVSKSPAVIVVVGAGNRRVPLVALDGQCKTLWSSELSAAAANLAACAARPWLALALSDGSVQVVNLTNGEKIARLDAEGEGADLAWAPGDDGIPLLVVARDDKLAAYRLSDQWSPPDQP